MCVCMHVLSLCLPVSARWKGDYPHFVWAPCGFSLLESAAACACLGSFVWMSSIARAAAASEQNIMQPAEPCLSTLLHRQRRMKRVREWEHPVIWWLSNMERERERERAWEWESARTHREMRLSGMNRLYHWLQKLPHTQQQQERRRYFQPRWLLI